MRVILKCVFFDKKECDIIVLFFSVLAIAISSIIIALELFYLNPNKIWLYLNAGIIFGSIILITRFILKYTYGGLSSREEKKALVIPIFVFVFILGMGTLLGEVYHRRDQNQFKELNSKESQSKEFAIIKKLADENNVYLRFGNLNSSWAHTRLQVPNASGASLYLKNGFCELNYTDESIKDMKSAYSNGNDTLFNQITLDVPKLAIMAHEFGHCLDIKRDLVTYNLDKVDPKNPKKVILSTYAINPAYKKDVDQNDLSTYFEAMRYSTRWKEVFSDLYSVGYLYIIYPAVADEVTKGLISFRAKTAEFDPTHDTRCWLKLVDRAQKPKSIDELVAWSDAIRNDKACLNVLNKHVLDTHAIY